MRTEQFLEGYDSGRHHIASLIDLEPEELRKALIQFAEFPYYESDGRECYYKCKSCGHFEDFEFINNECELKIDFTKIVDCKEWKQHD